jgi:hypothetical protein
MVRHHKTIFSPFFDRMVGSESTGDYNLEIQDIRENILEITTILHYLEFRIVIVTHTGSLYEDKAYCTLEN